MVEALGKRPCDDVPDVGVTEDGASSYVSGTGPGQCQQHGPTLGDGFRFHRRSRLQLPRKLHDYMISAMTCDGWEPVQGVTLQERLVLFLRPKPHRQLSIWRCQDDELVVTCSSRACLEQTLHASDPSTLLMAATGLVRWKTRLGPPWPAPPFLCFHGFVRAADPEFSKPLSANAQ